MGNHTVDDKKKGFIEGAAGINDKTKTTSVAWQNNRPQALEIEVTNNAEPTNLPFMLEGVVASTDGYVSIAAKDITVAEQQKRKASKSKNENVRD